MLTLVNVNILNKGNKLIFTQPTSFEIKSGEIWMLKGPNGIGKSSLYEALIGLRPINFGQIYIDHNEQDVLINPLPPADRVHLGLKYVSQANALFDNFSIIQNLTMCAEFLLPKAKIKEAVNDAITKFNLGTFAHKSPYQLSGGQKRLAELSKITIGECKVVLMDEPFAAIDENKIEDVLNILVSLSENGMSIFMNDHNNAAVEKISTHQLHLTNTFTKIKDKQSYAS
jgi:ABC-type lipopolysaccharide export system ATPase subunit